MKNFKRSAACVAAAVVLALAGCASTGEGGGVGDFFSDATITTKVKTAIFNEPGLSVMNVSVTTEDKVVMLTGSVKTRAEKAKVAELARKVEGVKMVKNEVQVKP